MPAGVSRCEYADDWNVERIGDVHRPAVIADENVA
jgi:hypothetical protein